MLRALSLLCLFATPATATEPLEAPALVRSKARLELRSTLSLPVATAPLTDGARFAKGDTLLTFDCSALHAEDRAARAAASAASLSVKAKTRLLRHGAIGRDELALAKAEQARAGAQRQAIRARSNACKLTAPFAGRVVRLNARRAAVPAANAPVITIIDDGDVDLEIVAPSRWLRWAEPGIAFTLHVEETDERLAARLTAIGPEVDPVSRTVRLFGEITGEITGEGRVLPGMSGRAIFEPAR